MPTSTVIKQKLKHGIDTQHLVHAYLFVGERGTNKKETALWLAERLFCINVDADGEPCGMCRNCRRIVHNEHPDVQWIEPDGQMIKVEQVQELRMEFNKSSLEGGKKIFIIDEADKMTESAANRLLTFIEEPRTDMLAILLTSNETQVLPTIVSRCQVITFTAKPDADLEADLITENIGVQKAKLISQLTHRRSEALELAKNESFAEKMTQANVWFQHLKSKDSMAFIDVQQVIVPVFKERRDAQQLLDILAIWVKDEAIAQPNDSTQHYFELISQAKEKLNANVSIQNVCEQLAWRWIQV